MIIDYAWGKPNYSLLRPQGVTGVVRYISHDAGKDLFLPELQQLQNRSIPVALVFESTAGRALRGYAAGHQDARFASERVKALHLPYTMPVYFAVDFDATDKQKPLVANYLKGAAVVLTKQRVGVYGGYYVVKYMYEHEVCNFFWQTYAWSGGLIWKAKALTRKLSPGETLQHPAINLYQYSNGHHLAGVSCDYNRAYQIDWGQFPRPKFPPKPPPTPKPPPSHNLGAHIYLRSLDGTERWEPFNQENLDYRYKQLKKGKWAEVDFMRVPEE